MRTDFAAFILTHGRANALHTYHSLKAGGYTGRIVVLVDDEDKQLAEYRRQYGEQVHVFSKQQAVDMTDACDNYGRRNSVVFARNISFVVAREMGLKYMLQLDDDYTLWAWGSNSENKYVTSNIDTTRLDEIFSAFVEFLETTPVKSIACAQGGDYIGGADNTIFDSGFTRPFRRKVMNTFFFRVDDEIEFRGRVNDDVNLSIDRARVGDIYITIPKVRIYQPETQKEPGGCTELYLEFGTYIKSFYSVLVAPSSVQITMMGRSNKRIHHRVNWRTAVPCIISEKYRKADA